MAPWNVAAWSPWAYETLRLDMPELYKSYPVKIMTCKLKKSTREIENNIMPCVMLLFLQHALGYHRRLICSYIVMKLSVHVILCHDQSNKG